MIGVLTHHWSIQGKFSETRELLERNGRAQSLAPGFVSRHMLNSTAEPNKISSLVIWKSDEIYDAWKSSPERAEAMLGSERFWDKPPVSERFVVGQCIFHGQ